MFQCCHPPTTGATDQVGTRPVDGVADGRDTGRTSGQSPDFPVDGGRGSLRPKSEPGITSKAGGETSAGHRDRTCCGVRSLDANLRPFPLKTFNDPKGALDVRLWSGLGRNPLFERAMAVNECGFCRALVKWCGKDALLDLKGGMRPELTVPSDVQVTEGEEHISAIRLSGRGPIRHYTPCCRTPFVNVHPKRTFPYASVPARTLPHKSVIAAL